MNHWQQRQTIIWGLEEKYQKSLTDTTLPPIFATVEMSEMNWIQFEHEVSCEKFLEADSGTSWKLFTNKECE